MTFRISIRATVVFSLLTLLALWAMSGCDRNKRETRSSREMLSLDEEERRRKFEDDLIQIRRYDEGLRETIAYAKGRPDLFPRTREVQLTPKQKHELREIWQTLLDYMRALDGIKEYWKEFHRYPALKERRSHAEAFLATYSAWLSQYRWGLEFIDLTVPSEPMEKLLDERNVEYDIPAKSFAALKWNIIHVKAVTRLLGSHQYYKTVITALEDADCDRKQWCGWAMGQVGQYHADAVLQLKDRAAVQFSYNAFDIARDTSFSAWFPVQKNVAAWMGDTRVRRLHQHLISKQQLDAMRKKLEPGDIIVARHNWYLSNIGLPGFWPHAELYLGSPEELARYFDDDEIDAYFREYFQADGLVAHLEKTEPEAWKAYLAAQEGHPNRVIEAISDGVVFSSLERAAGADYVGVMRPNRSKRAKAVAIARAFSMYGRAYDFNFDFHTDDTLVCTELVHKSWRPTSHSRGLDFELKEVMGRMTLPANDLVRQFATQPAGEQDLNFVYFLDGREKQGQAIVADEAAFRASWQRPKWDTMQK